MVVTDAARSPWPYPCKSTSHPLGGHKSKWDSIAVVSSTGRVASTQAAKPEVRWKTPRNWGLRIPILLKMAAAENGKDKRYPIRSEESSPVPSLQAGS